MTTQHCTLHMRSCRPVPEGGRLLCPLGTLTSGASVARFPVRELPAGSAEGSPFGGLPVSSMAGFGHLWSADC